MAVAQDKLEVQVAESQSMEIYRIDPLHDRRWERLIDTHPCACVYHTPAWLRALRRTYGYEPIAFTTSSPAEPITNGIVFCHVQSWLTGSRMVSVPFADHCQPLFHAAEDRQELATVLPKIAEQEHCDYIELRLFDQEALIAEEYGLTQSQAFAHHRLDLTPELPVLFNRFHKSCFQRKIQRAEKTGLAYSAGTSDEMLQQFYSLLVMTRRRHGVPPQPFRWFANLRDLFGDAFRIRMASLREKPVASIVTLQHKGKVVYKYGGSDATFHSLGAVPFLFWRAIQEAKSEGASELDLGRSDLDGVGLIAFKNHMGGTAGSLSYYRRPQQSASASYFSSLIRRSSLAAYVPDRLFRAAGSFLYRHVG